MKYIEELVTYKKDIDAIQIAEILWLSQFMDSESSKVKEKPKTTSDIDDTEIEEPIEEDLPSIEDEASELIDKSTPIHEDKKQKYGFDKEQDNGSTYTTNITQKEKFPKIEKQFQSLKVKQNRISKQLLDEIKTADYIATTGYFHPIFSEIKSKESYFSLHIIIDKSESMFLWESYTQHFIKSMKFSTIFTDMHIFELDSSQKEPFVCAINSDNSINLNSAIFREKKSITLIFSDITGDSWKSNKMFAVLDKWSKGSFVTIVSMLPKRMWKKTPLRQGISLFMKPRKSLPKNKDLKAEFNFMGTKTAEKAINIPMLTFDSYSFSHLSNVLMSKKDSWVDSRIFKNLVVKEVAKSKKSNITPKERVKNFFSFALPKTRELAIYCSVLPLNQEIIREVIEKRDLGTEKDVFSEFYFGGLIDKDVEITFGEYAFYEGVAKELRQYISVQEMKILLHQVSEVMSNSFLVDTKKINLLYEFTHGSEELNDNERALVELMIEVLEDKGRFYEGEVKRLRDNVGSIEQEKFLEIEESNLIILYKEDTLDINLDLVVDYLNKICNYLIFKAGKTIFEIKDKVVSASISYEKLDPLLHEESENSLRSILFTEKPYDNNYFFEPNDSYHNLRIVSFSGWNTLTKLPKNNGLVYFIGWLVALISDSFSRHYESTGCIYDFSGNKTDIDNNMREPYICQNCFDIISQKNAFFNNEILDDLNSILDFVGKVSKNDLDVFAKEYEVSESIVFKLMRIGWDESNIIKDYLLSDRHRTDFLLAYKGKNLAVIECKLFVHEVKAGLTQAIFYGKQLNIDYVYSTNGLEIYEYSIDKQKGNFIDNYPSPDELWERYNTPQKKLRDYPYLNKNLKRHHKEAIVTIIEEIINDNNRILLSLVASVGKEIILLEVLHKLDKSNWYENRKPRVLIIVNKNNTRYMERQFERLDEKFIKFITFRDMRTNYNEYDIVIIEEVPRARDKVVRRDKWKELLHNSNNPIFINFTTLYQDKMKVDFGGLSYEYSLEDSIKDGNTRPYKIIPINESLEVPLSIKLGKKGIRALITIILKNIAFKDGIGKTIIICNNIEDVNQVGIALEDTDITQYITLTSEKRQDTWREVYDFQRGSDTRSNIRILIMTKHISDIEFPYIDNIVLMTPIASKYQLVSLLSTRVEKRNLFTQKYIKVIDCFFDEHKNYYNLNLLENDSYPSKNLESFRVEQSKKAQFERIQREKKKKELEAQKEWRAIYDSSSLDVLELFVEKYPDSIYIEAVKKRILNIEYINRKRKEFLESLPPVERKLEELYKDERNIPKSTFLFKKIQDGLFDFDKFEALRFLKKMMMNENKWKEKSTKNRKAHVRTLAVIKMLGCGTKDKINIVEDISQNIKDTFRDVNEQILREEKEQKRKK